MPSAASVCSPSALVAGPAWWVTPASRALEHQVVEKKTENAYLKSNPAHWWWANRQQEEGIVIVSGLGGVAVAQVFNSVPGAG